MILFTQEEIKMGVSIVSKDIIHYCNTHNIGDVVLLSVLNGGIFFTVDLARKLIGHLSMDIDTVKVSSYKKNSQQTKPILECKWKTLIRNKHVIVVEDIIDSGKSIEFLLQEIRKEKPQTIQVASLLKRYNTPNIPNHHYGLIVTDNSWIYGYGMDNNGVDRNLENIYKIRRQ